MTPWMYAVADVLDLLALQSKHFSLRPGEDGCGAKGFQLRDPRTDADLTVTLYPSSPEAQAWADSLACESNDFLPMPPLAAEAKDHTPDNGDDEAACPLEVLRGKAWVTEVGAVRLLSLPPKALGNRRRAGRIPRELYDQNGEHGHVRYRTVALLAYAERDTRSAAQPVSRKRNRLPARL